MPATPKDLLWLKDLDRCDVFNPCRGCDRCVEGGKPWELARDEWLSALETAKERDHARHSS